MVKLEELENLVVSETNRPTPIKEYSLSELTNMKKVYCEEIIKLVKFIEENMVKLSSTEKIENMKISLILIKANDLKNAMDYNPEEKYDPRRAPDFVSDFHGSFSFESLIKFIHDLNSKVRVTLKKEEFSDYSIYKSILNETKNAFKNMGIKTVSKESLYQAYFNPRSDRTLSESLGIGLAESGELNNNIEIDAIPYFITMPVFNVEGKIYKYYDLAVNKPSCWYNKDWYFNLFNETEYDSRHVNTNDAKELNRMLEENKNNVSYNPRQM